MLAKVQRVMLPLMLCKQTKTVFWDVSENKKPSNFLNKLRCHSVDVKHSLPYQLTCQAFTKKHSLQLLSYQDILLQHDVFNERFLTGLFNLTRKKSESKLTSCNQSGYKKSTWTNIISRIFFVWHTIDWHVNSIQFNVSFLLLVRSTNRKTNRWQNNLKSWRIKTWHKEP